MKKTCSDRLVPFDNAAKIDAMKKKVMLLLDGETVPKLLITIVRYVLPSEDHNVQKLLHLYLEIIEKTDLKGKILPEMISICQDLRKHPYEYIRGVTLRFLCRLVKTDIIEPLIPSVLANLEHRRTFETRNANIFNLPQAEKLLTDVPEMIEKVLSTEADPSAKRNAFLMFFTCAEDRAIYHLFTRVGRVSDWGESLQMLVLKLIRNVCRGTEREKRKYIRITVYLLAVPSEAVVYEGAGTLLSLTSVPTAIIAAASTYCQLLLSEIDYDVKLTVLDRLNELKSSHREIMVEMIIYILKALSNPNHDIRRKTLDLVLDLITPQNITKVVITLKKVGVKTQSGDSEKDREYRQMLIEAIRSCAIKFPEVTRTAVHVLMGFLGDSNVASALDVAVFVRETIKTNPKLRVSIIKRLLDTFYQIRFASVCSCALLIISDYCFSLSEVESGIATIKQCLGDLPFYLDSEEVDTNNDSKKKSKKVNSKTISSKTSGNLRSLIVSGDFLLGAVVACTLTKLILRLTELQPSKRKVERESTQVLLVISMLCNPSEGINKILMQSCHESFVRMLKQQRETEEQKAKEKNSATFNI